MNLQNILTRYGCTLVFISPALLAQGTLADYRRGQAFAEKSQGLVVDVPGPMNWIGSTEHFWYSKSVKGGTEFVLVDADAATKKPAFDHARLAAAISSAMGKQYSALTLPFAPVPFGRGGPPGPLAAAPPTSPLTFIDNERAIQFGTGGFVWKCGLSEYVCSKGESIRPDAPFGRRGTGRPPEDDPLYVPEMPGGDPVDGLEYLPPQQGAGRGFGFGQAASEPPVRPSPDKKWEALIENFNVFLRPVGSTEKAVALSLDGSEGNYYTLRSIAWSPDSSKIVAYHTRPGYDRQVHYIESSPADQLQPKHSSSLYRKPGDALDIAYPALFDIATKGEIEIDNALFPHAYSLSAPVWWKDGRGFTFEYNQRGHQIYRVIEVDAQTGKARALITEQSPTFIYYTDMSPGLSGGKRYRHDINDGKEIIWASERDGWEHLYLYDGVTGKVKNQITKGNWLVRFIEAIDDDKRQIWFQASGKNPGEDPYFAHYYRINFDGSGLTRLTEANGNHTLAFSTDHKYYVDTWSRVDLPPVAQLRRRDDQKVLLDLEKGDDSQLRVSGLKPTEVFVAKGRDGITDIWGTIVRPVNFDPSRKYPVIEQIYAGPQGSFVPKNFSAIPGPQALAELGFIVVQIDGMGTSNRSKAFHDVAWKNLGDAGFPDRILWHKAVAAKYPYYDISRMGIYGTSAGGQSAVGGMLFHPEFYKVAVSNSGCHDNRMDKIWWNELWMGWPLGPHYAAASNVDNAAKLQGKVLLIAGEMDTNVDPASTLQVVDALVKARKHFDMLYIPGQNHGVGVLSNQHYLQDYFVHNLLGVEPPDWNHTVDPVETVPTGN